MKNVKSQYKSILFDANVCIDLIVNRSLDTDSKKKLFHYLLKTNTTVYIPAMSIDTIYYILTSSLKIDKVKAKLAISKLLEFSKLLHTCDKSVRNAFLSDISDFEDAIINSVAEVNQIGAIITQNTKDFKNSNLPIFSPTEFITLFQV